eukprot:tig00020704_g13156.t1
MPKIEVKHLDGGLKYLPELQFVCEDEHPGEPHATGWPEAAILEIGPENIRSLSLSSRGLTEVPDEQLDRLVNLESITLRDNQLNDLPPGLARLPRLKSINVKDNPLVCVPPNLRHKASRGSLAREDVLSYLEAQGHKYTRRHSQSMRRVSVNSGSEPESESDEEEEGGCTWVPRFVCCGSAAPRRAGREFDLDAVVALRDDSAAAVGAAVCGELRKLDGALRVAVHSDRAAPGEAARQREVVGRSRALVLVLSEGVLECEHALADVTTAVESGRAVVALRPEGAPEPPAGEALEAIAVPPGVKHEAGVVRAALRAATTKAPLAWPRESGKPQEDAARQLLTLVRGA